MNLREWQEKAFPLWWAKKRGIIKVVTGGGKTFFAIHCLKKYLEEKELGFGVAMIALRLSITGIGGGPSLFSVAEIIGKSETLKRLKESPKIIDSLKE